MIKFKDLSTSDKEIIQSFTINSNRQNCDLSFANLISWRFLYNTQYAIVDNHLVFRFYRGRNLSYMMPVPKPMNVDNEADVNPLHHTCKPEIIKILRDDAIAMGHSFTLLGICECHVACLEQMFGSDFEIIPNRDTADYIYLRERLATLAGKKLQSKRNHVNKFKKLYPHYEYKPLTKEMIEQCIVLERQWQGDQQDEAQDDSRMSELRSMTRAFHRWDKLGLMGGTIWVDNQLVAFTYGCAINHNTFDVCVEKADTAYQGAFAIINQEFVNHLPAQYTYINREEDLGEEGLRYAKLSYKPDILLMKYVMTEPRPLQQFEDTARIKAETKTLWQQVFNDSEAFVTLYFDKVYKHQHNIVCQIDKKVVGALQTLPHRLWYHCEETKAVYVSGVSVLPQYQEQNVGNNLMAQAHFKLYQQQVVFATLIPAEEWLYKWYRKLGYAQAITCTPAPDDIREMSFDVYDVWQRNKPCTLLHTAEDYQVIQEDIALGGIHYRPKPTDIPAMIRVINAQKALEMFAKAHREVECLLRVVDDRHIPMNNAYYYIEGGRVEQSDEPNATATKLNIEQLANFIFETTNADMTLMLN